MKQLVLFAKTSANNITVSYQVGVINHETTLVKDNTLAGLRVGKLGRDPLRPPIYTPDKPFILTFSNNEFDDLWLVLTWGKAE